MANRQGAIRAGRAFVEISGDGSKLVRALSRSQRKINDFGNAVQNVGANVAKAGALMLTPFALGASTFASFSDSMLTVKAVTGATVKEFDSLEKAVNLS